MPSDIRTALQQARALGISRLDAQGLLAHQLDVPRTWLLTHDDAPLADAAQARFDEGCRHLAAGMPLAYLTGMREFHGLMLAVSPAVLVPRPDTETLVDWALALLHAQLGALAAWPQPRVLDLGTGSGAVALALKHRCARADVTAIDVSADAVAMARHNAARLDLAVQVLAGHWLEPVAGCRFELIVSNPPYVALGDPHLAALTHEPALALISGAQGLDAIAHLARHAPHHLSDGGWLLFEHGWQQDADVRGLLVERGFVSVETRQDLAGQPRCTGGRWAG